MQSTKVTVLINNALNYNCFLIENYITEKRNLSLFN